MESFPGDGEGSPDDLTGGKRKSKLKTLKIRLFGRTKRETKFSQSASDVTEAEGLGSAENLCSGVLGSRAMSHDSIFLPDQELSSPEQPRVLSQENVQGRIKELQMKLLQQNMRLGPPPLVLPMKHPKDLGGSSEDDGLPHSPPEISIGNNMAPRGLSYKACSQPLSRPLSPVPKPPLTNSAPHTPSAPQTAFSPAPPALDFITPAQFTPCLDNSAARHRMSIKPRNQRASAKNKRLNMTESRPRSESLNNFDQQLTEEEEGPAITGGRTRLRCHSTLILKSQQGGSTTPTAPPELTPLKSSSTDSEGSPKKPTLPCKLSPQEQPYPGVPVVSPAPVTRQLPGAKQPQPSSVTTVQDLRYTPQQQTLKQSLGDPKPPDPSQTKRDILSKSGVPNSTPSTEGSPKDEPLLSARPTASLTAVVTLRTSSLRSKTDARAGGQSTTQPPAGQEDTGQAEPMSTGRAPKPGSGPFLFSINSAKGRETPRMGSGGFLVVVEQAGDGAKREEGTEVKLNPSNASQRGQEQQRGRRERDKPKEEELTAIDMEGKVSEGVEVENSEGVEDAVEATEETEVDGKIAFGMNLRSISLSPRVQAEATTSQSDLKIKRHSAEAGALLLAPYTPSSNPTGLEGLRDTPPTRANSMPKKLYTNNWVSPTTLSSSRGRAGSLREADTATPVQPTPSPLIKEAQTTPATPKEDQTLPVLPIEAQATTSAPQNPLTAPHAAPQAAVSWMSMAWGKTRGLQQLFTSSLPREFTGMQSPTQPQAQTTTQPHTPSLARIVMQTQRQNATQPQTTMPPQAQTTMQPLTAKLLESQNAVKPPQTAAQAPTQTTNLPVTQTTKHLQTTKTPQTQNGTQPQTMTQQSTQNSKPSTQTSNQINTRAAQPTATQPLAQSTQCSVSQVTPQSSRRANQPTLCPTPQTQAQITLRISPMGETSTQPPWSALNLNPIPQPKPALAPTATPVQLLVRGEKIPGDQRNSEGAAVSTEKRVDRDRPSTVGGTAAFLEKRAEWTPPAGSKVELRRTRTPPESQPTAELAAPPKATPSHRDAKLDRRPESSPTIVAGRLADREDKWLRKNMPTSLSPSSPSSSSPLQTISDSGGQPSWMELAKRKSMAWNDKTMD
ncbi:mucin-2 isoform X2 [Oncorhynchus kisutch]|uniref:Mucin-2 n=2 Tax=Oncorhynchus kisutch TaxID=8019 RepID=A0A8C7N413_ONCKI|nr:mucin-2 isoform X2 [Oncorhynchus kisutch]XP_031656019.1 mucin-2 isoform X2 [Oncorhynchus kisutch]XP_031656024.1 mucin-2 isoform X2 [Oncorhynchus kisutch]XP_031656032.1 mucin-2 isoform X2 [Oncorhynchus kisutch]XP_031656035.1 mucin-2 isoform X2 [Oncorhynchus kisutch]